MSGTGLSMETAHDGFAIFVFAYLTKPRIAAVEGAAQAGVFENCLASDMIVAPRNPEALLLTEMRVRSSRDRIAETRFARARGALNFAKARARSCDLQAAPAKTSGVIIFGHTKNRYWSGYLM